MDNPLPLVLASSSPFRRELLTKLGLTFQTDSPDVDEAALAGETPAAQAARLAECKAKALANRYPAHLIIGSDQVAEIAGHTLGKPGNREGAIAQLQAASGRSMRFHTALYVWNSRDGIGKGAVDSTTVYFRRLDVRQIQAYIDREQPYGCAGSFKSEGLGIALFERIETEDPNALIGLPLIRLVAILEQFGVAVL